MEDKRSKPTILIVEDVPIQAKKLQFVLLKLGYNVIWKENGLLAVEELEKSEYDLIISDYQMPEMDGLELLEVIKKNIKTRHIPFILLTTIEDDNIFFRSLKLGASEFINKPFRKEELELRCRNLITLYKYQTLIEDDNKDLESELIEKNKILEMSFNDLKNAHKELVDMQSQLVQSSKMASLGVMGAGVAHEINNPLTVIKSYNKKLSRLIEKGSVSEEQILKINGTIEKSVERIIKIVSHLKLFSGSEDYQDDSELRVINLTEVINDLQDFYGGLVSKYDIKVDIDFAAEPITVRGYQTMFEQIFLNLIHNSVDAMEKTKKKILTIKTFIENGDRGVVEIGDSGEGIPKEVLNKIFDPFFTTKEPGKGTGLGMSLVKTYVKECGGDVSCVSSPGSTIFTLKFEFVSEEN